MKTTRVLIVGGGFAGISCARRLVRNTHVQVTLFDKNNYNKFTPLLYQVATSALSVDDVAVSFRNYFLGKKNINIKMAEVIAIDPEKCQITTQDHQQYEGDYLVLAIGSCVHFYNVPGADKYCFPLYTLDDALNLRSRVIDAFETADRHPELISQGLLNFVVVGGGSTGTEIAGSIADMLRSTLPKEFTHIDLLQARIYLIDGLPHILPPFSGPSQQYAENILQARGVQLKLGVMVSEVSENSVKLSNGETILTRTVIWAGGLKASPIKSQSLIPLGHQGRIQVEKNLTIKGYPQAFAIGDVAEISGDDEHFLPQLAAVAKQCGEWTAQNILLEIEGKKKKDFKYNDKGIMAMIGKNAAVAEFGVKRRKLKGFPAYLAWLSVHALLLKTLRQKITAVLQWTLKYFGYSSFLQILDHDDPNRICVEKANQSSGDARHSG